MYPGESHVFMCATFCKSMLFADDVRRGGPCASVLPGNAVR